MNTHSKPMGKGPVGKGSGSTILIVDDSPLNIGTIASYLEKQGFTILAARDGMSGLEKAEYARPDLILLDVMMPGMDGFEVCRRLKAEPATQNIPVIFMTALADARHKVRGFDSGAVDYVTKPIQHEEVLARVTTHLRLRELTEHLEQKVAERTAELELAYKNLERLDKAKSDFIYVTSHELRTPLAVIDGYTHLLKQNAAVAVDEEALGLVNSILDGTSHMLETIGNIFDVSRIDNDLMKPVKKEVILEALIEEVCQLLESAVQERQLTLKRVGLNQLPEIQGDRELLTKLFAHLIVNAVKFTPDGGQICISGRTINSTTQQVEIIIEDSGIGIHPDYLDLIFEKFYQTGHVRFHSSGKTTYKGGGPGLGLAIAKGIVTSHGGQIWAESEAHDETRFPGSRFYVRLPVAPSDV